MKSKTADLIWESASIEPSALERNEETVAHRLVAASPAELIADRTSVERRPKVFEVRLKSHDLGVM